MTAVLRQFPVLINLGLIGSVAMLAPALHALWLENFGLAWIFAFHAFLGSVCCVILGFATSKEHRSSHPVQQVLMLLLAYALLPLLLAAPLSAAVPAITYAQAYFEMLSSMTTTGATVFADPGALPDPLHLWRALTAWAGGLMILVVAVAVLGPLQIGGFEVEHAATQYMSEDRGVRSRGIENARARLLSNLRVILPPYAILTVALTLGLIILGDRALVALIHAMSIMSTSGITPLPSFGDAASGRAGEFLIFVFLLIVLTRRATSTPRWDLMRETLDPEMRLALTAVFGITALLFLRHFLGAIEVKGQENFGAALAALWGSLFSILSFISTTGFESGDWSVMRNWSGLGTTGLILLALCTLGGGIATTAGGVKLLRVYALYKHGVREMQRLIHPHSVGGAGITARRIRRRGAQIAWVFLMLFLISISVLMLALTFLGQTFEDAIALSVAALTTTGPAASTLNPALGYDGLGPWVLGALSVGMIFGRLELLVLISVLNPAFWRN